MKKDCSMFCTCYAYAATANGAAVVCSSTSSSRAIEGAVEGAAGYLCLCSKITIAAEGVWWW